MIILGIDPGVGGGLAWFASRSKQLVNVCDMPTVKASRGKSALDVDGKQLTYMIGLSKIDLAVVEMVQSRPRQGGQFAFGANYGRILGILECMGVPMLDVSAQKWKQQMHLRGQDKSKSVLLATELFPTFARQFHGPRGAGLDGRAEAALLAYYGAMQVAHLKLGAVNGGVA